MARKLNLAVAQLGPIQRNETRQEVVERLVAMLKEAKGRQAEFVVFPELALTTFFPRWFFTDDQEIDSFFETEMPNAATQPLFDAAREHGVGFCLGYAEIERRNGVRHRFNTSILVDQTGAIQGKYRKVHLPGHAEDEPHRPFQHLEKRYFEVGDLGFPTFDMGGVKYGMYICNDRRWPEIWRVLGLQGVELVCGGYNTPMHNPAVPQHDHLTSFHHLLSMQAGAYQNGTWAASAAKAGLEANSVLLGHSCIVSPAGEIVAMTSSLEDEVITATCDLDMCRALKEHMFNFKMHRQPQFYGPISDGY